MKGDGDMTNEEMQALRAMMKEELQIQKAEIMHDVTVLMDAQFKHRFDLLAENQGIMIEKLDDMEIMYTRIAALEAMVKKLNREVQQLKKAQ